MYVKSKWNPPPWVVPLVVQKRYAAFSSRIQALFARRRGKNNLRHHQRETLQWLRSQDDFVVVNCDKNLGPALMGKNKFFRLVLHHLTTTGVYKRITFREARHAVLPCIKEL
jgi:hypothetical protein